MLIAWSYDFVVVQIDKAYPRDFMQRGRVRVLLKKEDGMFCNPAIPSSKGYISLSVPYPLVIYVVSWLSNLLDVVALTYRFLLINCLARHY